MYTVHDIIRAAVRGSIGLLRMQAIAGTSSSINYDDFKHETLAVITVLDFFFVITICLEERFSTANTFTLTTDPALTQTAA